MSGNTTARVAARDWLSAMRQRDRSKPSMFQGRYRHLSSTRQGKCLERENQGVNSLSGVSRWGHHTFGNTTPDTTSEIDP